MTALEGPVLELAREAAEWRLLGLLFESPAGRWREQVGALGAEIEDPQLRAAAARAQEEADEALYYSVFGPGGPASPREASYFASVELGSLMAELEAHYRAFAYEPAVAEPPDHVAVEAGFIAYLLLKEAYALAGGEAESAALAAEAARRFRDRHLSRLGAALERLFAGAGIEYLHLASQALAKRCGNPPRSQTVLPVIEDGGAGQFDCG